MNAQHTPGPWEVSKDATPDYAPQYTVYDEASGERVATAFQAEANARLIAAAPDLLDACQRAYAALQNMRCVDEEQAVLVYAIEAAGATVGGE